MLQQEAWSHLVLQMPNHAASTEYSLSVCMELLVRTGGTGLHDCLSSEAILKMNHLRQLAEGCPVRGDSVIEPG
jgi:hypothetical protein